MHPTLDPLPLARNFLAAACLLAAVPCADAQSTDTLVVRSSILGQARNVYVSLPPSWGATDRPYPVIVVLDGEGYTEPAVTLEGALVRLGHVPEAIVVGIPNAGGFRGRVHDMTPPGLSVSGSSRNEGGDDFLDFLEREVLPEVDRRWRGGGPRTLVGHSSGGVIATWAAATRSDVFPIVVSIDAPVLLQEEWLAQRLLQRARRGGDAPVRYVSLESRFGWSDARWAELVAAAPSSWLLHRETLGGESHESMYFLGIYQGLKYAWSDYSIVGAPFFPRGTTIGVFDHFAALEALFGVQLPPPAPVLRRLLEDLLTEGYLEPARRALAWLTEGYGPQPDAAELEEQVERVARLLPLAETVEDLKAVPWPTPEQMAPYLGEWDGEQWMVETEKTPFEVSLRVEDGAVVGEITYVFGNTRDTQALDMIRLLPDGLEIGKMNGMRPAGMIVKTGRLDGNVLAGEEAMRGIVLPLPGGFAPPRIYFRMTRRPGHDAGRG